MFLVWRCIELIDQLLTVFSIANDTNFYLISRCAEPDQMSVLGLADGTHGSDQRDPLADTLICTLEYFYLSQRYVFFCILLFLNSFQ